MVYISKGSAMIVLTVNTGSSSVRLNIFRSEADGQLEALAEAHHTYDGSEPQQMLKQFLANNGLLSVALVSHRVVHGGNHFNAPCLLDNEVEREIMRLAPLAPLHNPVALQWIQAAREIMGTSVPQIAVFDTAFYAGLPQVAKTYAIPAKLSLKHGLRRYGFHGLAHVFPPHNFPLSLSG